MEMNTTKITRIQKIRATNLMYNSEMYNHLMEVNKYAYEQNCPGLTFAECKQLEELCDKALIGIEEDTRDTMELFVKEAIKEREEQKK